MNSEQKLARIVAPEAGESGLTMTQGTQVFVGDVQVKGITRIELICDVNDVWRARIDMMVQPPADLSALAVFHRPSLLARIARWYRALPPARDGGPG